MHAPALSRRLKHRLLVAGVLGVAAHGCSRSHYRERTDKDVAGVITQKNVFPDWKVDNWHVYPDPAARYADPSCPDDPPYPPDDYAAWLTSPNPQRPSKTAGSGRYEGTGYLDKIREWDGVNRTEADQQKKAEEKKPDEKAKPDDPAVKPASWAIELEPPEQAKKEPGQAEAGTAVEGTDPEGRPSYLVALKSDQTPFRIKLDQAVELAVLNSREFQDRREDLYLAALPVTLERFGFAAQAFASEQLVREFAGRDLPNAGQRWRIDGEAGVSKFFPTGGQLLLRFANQIVLDLSSGRPDVAVGNATFTFIQPLLRGGGYAVTLEPLTQSERNLLYGIRSYARFRKSFYVAIAGQGDYTNNPYGLQGLSANLGRGIGNNLTAPRAGYLPVLLRSATLANETKNIAALEQYLKLYQNLKEGGGVTELQVVRVEQQLLRSRNTFLTNSRLFADNLDNFKLQLGVPTTLSLELDDGPLRPQRKQLQRFEQVYTDLGDFQAAVSQFNPAETPAQVRQRWIALLTESSLARGTQFSKDYPELVRKAATLSAEELAKIVADRTAERLKLLDKRAERQLAGKPDSPADIRELESVESAIDLARFEQALRRYDGRPWLTRNRDRQVAEQQALFRQVADAGLLIAIRARNQRLDAIRADWPDLPAIAIDGADLLTVPLDEANERVSRAALVNRLDLMNARGQVVDAYRQIAVRANALQGQFDVRYDLNAGSPARDNIPFALGGSRTRHALTLNLEAPLVRRAERNLYRAAQIGYQRQRRTLMAFEDNILVDVRSDLRNVRALAETYDFQCRAVELAYAQVDNARSTLLAPPDPTAARGAAGEVAALTQQLLDAQSTLLQAQNDLYTSWVNYQLARMELALDLETLPLDARGIWTDEQPAARQAPPP